MEGIELAAVDLNLLVVFDLLMAERSVTLAARRLGRSQSAVSYSLARLREAFNDALLVRTRGGLVPTPKAEALHREVGAVLQRLREVVQGLAAFDPSRERRTFTIAMNDYTQTVFLPQLVRRLSQTAPGVNLHILPLADDVEQILEDGAADLAVGVIFLERPGLRVRRMFDERFVCLVRRDHPEVGDVLTLEKFLELPHALIMPRGRPGSVVDSALAALGHTRRVALRVPHYLTAPLVVAETDLVLTMPERLARLLATPLPVRMLPPPIELPDFSVRLGWHDRRQGDVGSTWLRGIITEIGASL